MAELGVVGGGDEGVGGRRSVKGTASSFPGTASDSEGPGSESTTTTVPVPPDQNDDLHVIASANANYTGNWYT